MSYIAVVSLCESSGACKCFAAGHKKREPIKDKELKRKLSVSLAWPS